MELTFHHIGIATKNILKAIEVYKKLGYSLQNDKTFHDPIQKVKICFMEMENHPLIELIEPAEKESPVQNILKKMGSTPYHTCYEIENINDFTPTAKENKFVQILKPTPAVAFEGRRISFYYNKEIGIIELLENEIPNI